jgi:hypothetical protein
MVDYFLEQWGLIKIRLVNAIEDSIETNEEVGSREKPDMMFNKYGWWVELVGKRINDGFEDGSRGKKHCVHGNLFVKRKTFVNNTCTSTLSSEVSLVFSFNIIIAANSVIMDASMACSWCMSRCWLFASLAGMERTIPFEMGRIAAFKALILLASIILTIGG